MNCFCKSCETPYEVPNRTLSRDRCPACIAEEPVQPKECLCRMCDEVFYIPHDHRKLLFCPTCKPKRLAETQKSGQSVLKARRAALFSERRLFNRINELALMSRAETAAILNVSIETIRRDEMAIIEQIRKLCGPLAKECGFVLTDPNSVRFAKS